MEMQPPPFQQDRPYHLHKIYAEIADADQKAKDSLSEQEGAKIHGEKLLQKALDILDKYGETHQDESQQVCCFGTPPATANVNGEEVQLTISTSTPSYLAVKDRIRVYCTDPTLSEKSRRQFFSIGQFGASVENWLGEPARSSQIEMASEILSYIEAKLSENPTPKS